MTNAYFSESPSFAIVRRIAHVMLKGWKAFHVLQKLDIHIFYMIYGRTDRTIKKDCQAFFIVIHAWKIRFHEDRSDSAAYMNEALGTLSFLNCVVIQKL